MKFRLNYLFTLAAILFLCSCDSSNQKAGTEEKFFDSCSVAVKDENTKLAEQMVSPGYTGELNNYWGDDTTKLDFKHVFDMGKIVKSIFYYENGHVQEEYAYKCGSLHGLRKRYYKDGTLFQKIPYRYGRMEGVGEEFSEKGVLRIRIVFKADSILSKQEF
jgi:antitoxin component YwqK of YwqJK toxin-antitoxin module